MVPTARLGKRSVGRIITSVDRDCCPKYPMQNRTMGSAPGLASLLDACHPTLTFPLLTRSVSITKHLAAEG